MGKHGIKAKMSIGKMGYSMPSEKTLKVLGSVILNIAMQSWAHASGGNGSQNHKLPGLFPGQQNMPIIDQWTT